MRRWHGILIGLLILAAGIGVRYKDPGVLVSLRLSVFRTYQELKPRVYQPEVPVRIVDIDEESLQRHGQWPWPRLLIAQLIERLQNAGAGAVVLDMVFPEPDRASPRRLVDSLADPDQRAALLGALSAIDLPDSDEVLAEVVARGGVVTGFAPFNEGSAKPKRIAGLAFKGANPLNFVRNFRGAIVNLPILENAAAGNGAMTAGSDKEGVVHRVPLYLSVGNELYPSLAVEGLRVGQGASTLEVKSSDARDLTSDRKKGVIDTRIGKAIAPTDPFGQLWLYDTGRIGERHVPAWEVLAPGFDNNRVAGMIVIVGVAATGLSDFLATPLSAAADPAEINAQVMEQIITQEFLDRPLWALGAEAIFLAVLGLALMTAFLPRGFGAVTSTMLGAVIVVSGLGVSWWAFTEHGLLLDPVYPVLVGIAIYLANSILNYLVSEAQRKEVRTAFGQYVAPALVDELARNPGALKLGGEIRDMTVLFCDVRNFTNISEQLDPEGLTHLLNRFLTVMSRQILSRRGTIDKYMGDAIMAFWNAPLPDDDHARHACETALAMVGALSGFNEEIQADKRYHGYDFGQFQCGIGLNSGPCLVGNMGSDQRFDYSVLGNTVNVASRVEGQCKTYGVPIIVGETTYTAVPDLAMLELDLIRVKGKRQAARIYALLGDSEVTRSDSFRGLADAHALLLSAYREQDWDAAKAALVRCREQSTEFQLDVLYDEYKARIAAFVADAPGADWDGVFVARTK